MRRTACRPVRAALVALAALWPFASAAAQTCEWGYNGFSGIDHLDRPIIKIAGGYNHVLVLKSDGTMAAWGSNQFGEANPPTLSQRVVDVSGGKNLSAALLEDGTLRIWGDSTYLETMPENLGTVIAMDCGRTFMTAVKSDGTVVVWGDPANAASSVPGGLSGVVGIAASSSHALALKSDGSVVAWGNNSFGQCNVPADLGPALAIDAGPSLSIALLPGGQARCWGFANTGVISDVVEIAANGGAACMLHSDGTVETFGSLPVFTGQYAALVPAAHIGMGQNFYVFQRTDGTFVARGPGPSGDFGETQAPPTVGRVVSMTIAGQWDKSRTISTDDGRLINWEPISNTLGSEPETLQLGVALRDLRMDSSRVYGRQPDGVWRSFHLGPFGEDPVSEPIAHAKSLSFSITHGLALLADLTVIPLNRTNPRDSAFTNIPRNLGAVAEVVAAEYGSLALRTDGTLAYWGDRPTSQGAFPANLSGLRSATIGPTIGAAVRADGTGVFWGGWNYGNGVPVSGGPFRAVSAGDLTLMWLREDGRVEMRGSTAFGVRAVPQGLTGVRELIPGADFSAATSAGQFPSDINGDGIIDGADLGVLLGAWGEVGTNGVGDINGDHLVDGADLGQLLANWGDVF